MIYMTDQPVEGKCIQPSELSEWGTALHSWASNEMKEEAPVMGEFSPTAYNEICFVELMGEFLPIKYAVKLLLW